MPQEEILKKNDDKPHSCMIAFTPMTPGEGELLFQEQAELFDTEPIFLTTKWNTAEGLRTEKSNAPKNNTFEFEAYPISLESKDHYIKEVSEPTTLKSSLELIEDNFINPFTHICISEETSTEGTTSKPTMIINNLIRESEPILVEISDTKILDKLENNWGTMEFLVIIEETGNLGSPFLWKGTGGESVDRSIRNCVRDLPELKRLRPGYYQITLGP